VKTYVILFSPLADKQAELSPGHQTQVIRQVEQSLPEKMYCDGSWTADQSLGKLKCSNINYP
jgi:hypothetical protein